MLERLLSVGRQKGLGIFLSFGLSTEPALAPTSEALRVLRSTRHPFGPSLLRRRLLKRSGSISSTVCVLRIRLEAVPDRLIGILRLDQFLALCRGQNPRESKDETHHRVFYSRSQCCCQEKSCRKAVHEWFHFLGIIRFERRAPIERDQGRSKRSKTADEQSARAGRSNES